MSKFIKTLIVINGILIPLVIVIMLGFIVYNLVKQNHYQAQETGILTQNVVSKDSVFVAKQGLDYSSPRSITGTENYYLPISVKTFEKPQSIESEVVLMECVKSNSYETNYFNIVFLDKNFRVLRRLLNQKASITRVIETQWTDSSIEDQVVVGSDDANGVVKLDRTIKNIAYTIAFQDTNRDGQLNGKDDADVYISDIAGGNLTKVTNNIDVKSVSFIQKNTQLFIEYTERKNIREEYKQLKFAIYNIQNKKLTLLDDISKEIQSINKILNTSKATK